MCSALTQGNDMDNLEELESNPIFLCMRLKPGQELEFPAQVQGTGPYMFHAHRPDDGEFLDIRPVLLYLDQKFRINSLQKLYWEQAQDVSKQFPKYRETYIMACLIAGLVVSGEDPDTAKWSVRKYMSAYAAALKKIEDQYDEHGGYDD